MPGRGLEGKLSDSFESPVCVSECVCLCLFPVYGNKFTWRVAASSATPNKNLREEQFLPKVQLREPRGSSAAALIIINNFRSLARSHPRSSFAWTYTYETPRTRNIIFTQIDIAKRRIGTKKKRNKMPCLLLWYLLLFSLYSSAYSGHYPASAKMLKESTLKVQGRRPLRPPLSRGAALGPHTTIVNINMNYARGLSLMFPAFDTRQRSGPWAISLIHFWVILLEEYGKRKTKQKTLHSIIIASPRSHRELRYRYRVPSIRRLFIN